MLLLILLTGCILYTSHWSAMSQLSVDATEQSHNDEAETEELAEVFSEFKEIQQHSLFYFLANQLSFSNPNFHLVCEYHRYLCDFSAHQNLCITNCVMRI